MGPSSAAYIPLCLWGPLHPSPPQDAPGPLPLAQVGITTLCPWQRLAGTARVCVVGEVRAEEEEG